MTAIHTTDALHEGDIIRITYPTRPGDPDRLNTHDFLAEVTHIEVFDEDSCAVVEGRGEVGDLYVTWKPLQGYFAGSWGCIGIPQTARPFSPLIMIVVRKADYEGRTWTERRQAIDEARAACPPVNPYVVARKRSDEAALRNLERSIEQQEAEGRTPRSTRYAL